MTRLFIYKMISLISTRTEQHRGSAPGIQTRACRALHHSYLRDPGCPSMSELRKQLAARCRDTRTEERRGSVPGIQVQGVPGLSSTLFARFGKSKDVRIRTPELLVSGPEHQSQSIPVSEKGSKPRTPETFGIGVSLHEN